MTQTRVTWNCQFSGQKRAYADTTTEGVITIESNFMDKGWEPWDSIGTDYAKKLAKPFVGWSDAPEDGTMDSWFEPRLRTFEKIGPGQWYVFVVRRYDD